MSSPITIAIADVLKSNPVLAVIIVGLTPSLTVVGGGAFTQSTYASKQYVDQKIQKLENSMTCGNASSNRALLGVHKFYLDKDHKLDPDNEYLNKTISDISRQIEDTRYTIKTKCIR